MAEFIEAVRQRPCLWDVYNKDYRHLDKKDMAWMEIVNMNFAEVKNISEAKAEWKKLRDSHRDSLKRNKNSKNHWKYAQLMEFLVPYMKCRPKRRGIGCNDPPSPQNFDNQIDESNEEYVEISVPTPNDISQYTPNDISEYTLDEYEVEEDPIETKKRKVEDDIVNLFKDIKESQKRREQDRETIRELKNMYQARHPMDLFLDSMGKTIKQMPSWMQIKVKRKIFAAVCDAEDELELSAPATGIGATNSDHMII